ncbi:MAG: toxin [Candidatus Omnitrophica bacterium]|nr:toxin [Candidatus Omnitrophota bacterium]
MAQYRWNPAKNDWLLQHRGISFEQIVWHIAEGYLLDVLFSDKAQYKGQKQLVVAVRGYAYLVPVVEEGEAIILKTIIPSRKLTKQYLRKGGTGDGATEARGT